MGSWWEKKARSYVVTVEEWDARCKWDDLTPEEQELCCGGGCGLELFGVKYIPDFAFRTCCCRHDFHYLRGGDERVRLLGDRNFKEEVRKLAREDETTGAPRVRNAWWYKRWAELYAGAVVNGGWLVWDYGPMRSREEILRLATLTRRAPRRL